MKNLILIIAVMTLISFAGYSAEVVNTNFNADPLVENQDRHQQGTQQQGTQGTQQQGTQGTEQQGTQQHGTDEYGTQQRGTQQQGTQQDRGIQQDRGTQQRGTQQDRGWQQGTQQQQTGIMGRDDDEDFEAISVTEVPDEVRSAVRREAGNYTISSAQKKELDNDEEVYKLTLTAAGREQVTKKYYSDGREFKDSDKDSGTQRGTQQRGTQQYGTDRDTDRGTQTSTQQRGTQTGTQQHGTQHDRGTQTQTGTQQRGQTQTGVMGRTSDDEDFESISVTDVPDEIRGAVRREAGNYTISSAQKKELDNDEEVYKLTLSAAGREPMTKKYYSDGREYKDGDKDRGTQQRGTQQYGTDRDSDRGTQTSTQQRGTQTGTQQQHGTHHRGTQTQTGTQQRGQTQTGVMGRTSDDEDFESISVTDVPDEVRGAVRREAGNYTISSAQKKELDNDEEVYKLTLSAAGREQMTKKYYSDGREYKDADKDRGTQQRGTQQYGTDRDSRGTQQHGTQQDRQDGAMQRGTQDRGVQQQGTQQTQTGVMGRSSDDEDFESVNINQVPDEVRNAVRREGQNMTISSAEKKEIDGDEVYRLTLSSPERGQVTQKYHSDGRKFEDGEKDRRDFRRD
jgi:hypothetical protein